MKDFMRQQQEWDDRAREAQAKAAQAFDRLLRRAEESASGQADALARLQAKSDTALSAEAAAQRARQALEEELRVTREQLLASQQQATSYRAEAQTVQALLDRLSLAAAPTTSKTARKKPAAA